jgi:hypothetical protein
MARHLNYNANKNVKTYLACLIALLRSLLDDKWQFFVIGLWGDAAVQRAAIFVT